MGDERMVSGCTGTIDAGEVTYRPDMYLPKPWEYPLWPNAIYDLFGAGLNEWWQRAAISITLAIAEYLVGLALAAAIGFAPIYMGTPAVYVLCAAFGFYMGRARWLTVQVPERLKCIRAVFDVTDERFHDAIAHACRVATRRRITIPLTTVAILAVWAAIGEFYYGQPGHWHDAVAELVAPSFGRKWYVGDPRWIKMIILDIFLGLGFGFVVPVIWGCLSGLLRLFWEIRTWRVVPVPAYVATALRPAANFLFWAATYYAVAVGVIAVVYGGSVNQFYVIAVAIFSTGGIICLLAPYFGIAAIIERARQGLGEDVATTYYRDIRPIAAGSAVVAGGVSPGRVNRGYRHLLDLERLMHAANEGTGLLFQTGYLVQGVLIQLSPTFLALAIVAIIDPTDFHSLISHLPFK